MAKSVEWVRGNAGRSFFLFLHSYEPHDPYTDSFFKDQEDIPPSDQIAYRTAKYDGDIRRTDSYFGELVQAFTEANLLERTLFVVTSDHGEDLGGRNPQHARMQYGHAHNLYDELLRVPLIFRGPGVPSGQSIDYQVRSIDILPTVLQLVGLSPGADFEGSSLGDMLRGSDRESRPVKEQTSPQTSPLQSVGYRISFRKTVTGKDLTTDQGPSSLDLTRDEELFKNLRALGYIQ